MYRRSGIVSMLVLTSYLLSGATSPQSCTTTQQPASIGPTKGEIIGAAVAVVAVVVVATVVLVEVHNSHHTIKGCVTAGPSGLRVEDTGNQKTYNVSGVTTGVKVGDVVRLHGDKQKKKKGETDQDFVIQKISKDYGACKVPADQTAATPPAPATPAP